VRFTPTGLPEVILIEPQVHRDDRGFFLETYHAGKYRAAGIDGPFVQDNHSRSIHGTLRGLHLQASHPQAKLIRVVEGEIYDVAVDVRLGSPTFGKWVGVTLTAESLKLCYIPVGFAHGFTVISQTAQVEYKCSALYDPASEIGIAWDDPQLNIQWPISRPTLSLRDQRNPRLDTLFDRLPTFGSTNL
jgi:dTDP-4-dehydrorhamnose 3,5-epimerase